MRALSIAVLVILTFSCSGIKVLSRDTGKSIYTKEFLESVEQIKQQYRAGKVDESLAQLQKMGQGDIKPVEKALIYNLIGVIYFGKDDFERAQLNFQLASQQAAEDPALMAQIYLNAASVYYKKNELEEAYNLLLKVNNQLLNKNEFKKSTMLTYKIANALGRTDVALINLARTLSTENDYNQIRSEPMLESLTSLFFSFEAGERANFLKTFEDEELKVTPYLEYLEVEKLYYSGSKTTAKSLLEHLIESHPEDTQTLFLAESFYFRIQNYSKMDAQSFGVILPLSGSNKEYAERILGGIDFGLSKIKEQNPIKLFMADDENSGAIGRVKVKELVDNYAVSIIIGGLFPAAAKEEYLEAKKYGVFFISLSPVYLPADQKDHLLLEIPGSVESQINSLFSKEVLDHFGKRTAIIYPETDSGNAYLNEFWRKAHSSGAKIVDVIKFEPNQTDYREKVQEILNLKYPRIRSEEYQLMDSIYSLEKKGSVRRLQVLKPVQDFDWVFVPAAPRDTLQLIPSFPYFDAFKVNIFGGPNWRIKSLAENSGKFGNIHFIGDDLSATDDQFFSAFESRYQTTPRILEVRGNDAFSIASKLVSTGQFSSRDELDVYIRTKGMISGQTGKWSLQDGIWLKEMAVLKIKRNGVESPFKSGPTTQPN